MSWSISLNGTPQSELREALEELKKSATQSNPDGADQFEEMIEAVVALTESGVLGDPDVKSFIVTANGHGNPSHEPQSGFVTDTISLSVRQA